MKDQLRTTLILDSDHKRTIQKKKQMSLYTKALFAEVIKGGECKWMNLQKHIEESHKAKN